MVFEGSPDLFHWETVAQHTQVLICRDILRKQETEVSIIVHHCEFQVLYFSVVDEHMPDLQMNGTPGIPFPIHAPVLSTFIW